MIWLLVGFINPTTFLKQRTDRAKAYILHSYTIHIYICSSETLDIELTIWGGGGYPGYGMLRKPGGVYGDPLGSDLPEIIGNFLN